MIIFKHKGSFKNIESFFKRTKKLNLSAILEKYGQAGVNALASYTPKDTGLTSSSWGYSVKTNNKGCSISWYNTNVVSGVNIAVILQYGHGTRTGGYVEGRDYINPALRPIFDKILLEAWAEVCSL